MKYPLNRLSYVEIRLVTFETAPELFGSKRGAHHDFSRSRFPLKSAGVSNFQLSPAAPGGPPGDPAIVAVSGENVSCARETIENSS